MYNFLNVLFRSSSGSMSEGFLLNTMKHTVKDCQVCSNQIEPATLKNESGSSPPNLSIPSDKILKRINIPEVIHVGVGCGSCKSNQIKGNAYRCFTCKYFVSCETCHESKTHQHPLQYVSSKQ